MALLYSGSYTNGIIFEQPNSTEELTIVDVLDIIDDNLYLEELDAYYDWGLKVQVESLRATYWLGSTLNKINYSEIYPEDSQATRIAKITEQESNNRIGLTAYRQKGNEPKIYLTTQLFQNVGREQQKELLDPFLARSSVKLLSYARKKRIGDKLIYKLRDYGNGLISSYGDFIQIEADCTWYVTGTRKEFVNLVSNSFGSTATITPTLLLPANNRRCKLTLMNAGTNPVSFHFGDESGLIINQCLRLNPGSTWNDEGFYIDRGNLWVATSTGESLILGKETERV